MSQPPSPSRPAPVSPAAIIPLRVPVGLRRAALATGLVLLAAAGLLFVVAAVWATDDRGGAADAAAAAIAGVVLLALGVARLATLRRRDARIELWPDRMVIRFDPFLRGPLQIPRGHVRAAVVDEGDGDRADDERFAVFSDFAWHAPTAPPTNRGWLYTRSGGSILPLLGHPSLAPDIAIVFDEAVALPVRDQQRRRGHPGRLPRLGALTIGLMGSTTDPAGARAALDAWGSTRALLESDFAVDRPRARALGLVADDDDAGAESPADARSARRRGLMAVAAAFALAGAVLAGGVASLTGAWLLFDARRAPILALALAVLGVALLLALIPRRLPSPEGGTIVGAIQHPRLFALVRQVAGRVGVAPPDEVRIVPAVNATVHETGGLRGRRVLSLGLPLIASLTERELAGVIAHEFGHFRGGDTRLGRVIARIDQHLSRTLAQLGAAGRRSITGLVVQPFVAAFHRMFLRLTGGMMRNAEFSADVLSAREVGADTVSQTLTRIGGVAAAFDAFWQTEFEPAVRHGNRPPLAMGFHRFCVQPATRAFIAETGLRLLREEPRDAAGSHPPLRDRVAALRNLDLPGAERSDGPALALLGDTDPVERSLLRSIVPGDALDHARQVSWDDVMTDVHLSDWRRHLLTVADRMGGLTITDLPLLATDPRSLAQRLGARDADTLREDDALRGAVWTLGAAFTLALADHGFTITAEPGGPVTASKGRSRIRTFEVVREMADGAIGHREWLRHCRVEGVADYPLAPDRFAFSMSDYPSTVDEPPAVE